MARHLSGKSKVMSLIPNAEKKIPLKVYTTPAHLPGKHPWLGQAAAAPRGEPPSNSQEPCHVGT